MREEGAQPLNSFIPSLGLRRCGGPAWGTEGAGRASVAHKGVGAAWAGGAILKAALIAGAAVHVPRIRAEAAGPVVAAVRRRGRESRAVIRLGAECAGHARRTERFPRASIARGRGRGILSVSGHLRRAAAVGSQIGRRGVLLREVFTPAVHHLLTGPPQVGFSLVSSRAAVLGMKVGGAE